MGTQTFQEVSKEIKKELPFLPEGTDLQKFFFEIKTKEPKRFKRLMFDRNGGNPVSEELEQILMNFVMSGFKHPNSSLYKCKPRKRSKRKN